MSIVQSHKKVKIGIIGAGNITKQHMQVISAIDWIEVVGITSRTRTRAEQLANEYKIAVCADDVCSMVEQCQPDALMVLVSSDQMFKVVSAVIPLGLPLFIEKPAGLYPEETKKLAEQAKKQGIQTMVGFNRRYYSIFHQGIELIKKHGALCGIMVEGHERMWKRADRLSDLMRSQWLYANSVHTIDLLRLFGGEAKEIKAIAHKRFEPRGDQFSAIMETESGAIGQYLSYWYSPGGWRVVLYGEGITVEFKPLESGRWIDKDFKEHEIRADDVDVKFKPGFFRQMEAFGNMIIDGKLIWPGLDMEGTYRTMLMAEQISANAVNKGVNV